MRYTHSRQIDKCLPIADWSDPMWNTEGFSPSIDQVWKDHYEEELPGFWNLRDD